MTHGSKMMKMDHRKRNLVLMANRIFCLQVMLCLPGMAQTSTRPSASQSPTVCKDFASPGVIQLSPESTNPNRLTLARKRFYLSPAPFDLATNVDFKTAPSIRAYYTGVGASPQLIDWLTENHCETIYCRELTPDEVSCDGGGSNQCVPEFASAYRIALLNLNGNQELARRWITNYEPLSSAKLRVGFFAAKTQWLERAVEAIERKLGGDYRIRSTIADKDGIAFFYDLCPGIYYVSSIAPIDVRGAALFWETAKPIKVEGPPDVNKAVAVTLAFPPGKDKKNFFVGKRVAEIGQ